MTVGARGNNVDSNHHQRQLDAIESGLSCALHRLDTRHCSNSPASIDAQRDSIQLHLQSEPRVHVAFSPLFPGSLTQRHVRLRTLAGPLPDVTPGKPAVTSSTQPTTVLPDPAAYYIGFRPIPDQWVAGPRTDRRQRTIEVVVRWENDRQPHINRTNHSGNSGNSDKSGNSGDSNNSGSTGFDQFDGIIALLQRLPRSQQVSLIIISSAPLSVAERSGVIDKLRDCAAPATIRFAEYGTDGDYLALLASSDLLVAANPTDCVDAVSLGVPAVCLNARDENTVDTQSPHPLSAAALHVTADALDSVSIRRQQASWLAQQVNKADEGCVLYSMQQLADVVAALAGLPLLATLSDHTIHQTDERQPFNPDEPILPLSELALSTTAASRLAGQLDLGRRKLTKLRESPVRFVRDSRFLPGS